MSEHPAVQTENRVVQVMLELKLFSPYPGSALSCSPVISSDCRHAGLHVPGSHSMLHQKGERSSKGSRWIFE